MILGLGAIAAFAIVMLAAGPAFAEVKTLDLVAESYTSEQTMYFEGTATASEQFVIKITKESTIKKVSKNAIFQALAGPDGEFVTQKLPKHTVYDVFRDREGIFNVTVTAGGGNDRQNDVTMLQLEVRDGKVTKYEPPVPEVILRPVDDKAVSVGVTVTQKIGLAEDSVQGATFKITSSPTVDFNLSGDNTFVWTPEQKHGSDRDVLYTFTVEAKKGNLKTTETFAITVKKAFDSPKVVPKPIAEPEPVQIDFEVDPAKGPQSYVDRYNNEATYKEWFDENYSQYSSIYEAVGLEAPVQLAPFVKEGVDPQTYVDRYNNEATYKAWFDKTYPQYSSIYKAVGLDEPMPVASFVEENVDPQTYVDRYNNEPAWKAWFEKNFAQYSTIYEAVGIQEISAEPEEQPYGSCGEGTMLVEETCIIPTEKQYGFCGEGTTLVDEVCVIGSGVSEKPWWQFW